MDIAGAGRGVENHVIEFSPLGIGNELLQSVACHTTAPKCGSRGVDKETDREEFYTIFVCRNNELATFYHFSEDVHLLQLEHFGDRGTKDVGIEKSDLITHSRERYGKIGCYRTLTYTALARTYGNHILHLWQHFPRFGARRLSGLYAYGNIDVLAYIGVDGSLGSFHHRLNKGVGALFKDDGEGDVHAVNAEVVFQHLGFYNVFPSSGVAHVQECVGNEFWIKCHLSILCVTRQI